MTPQASLYSPSRYAYFRLKGAARRWNCGRRFGHFPAYDPAGICKSCARCGTPLP